MSDKKILIEALLEKILSVGQRFSFHGREHEFPRLKELLEYQQEVATAESRQNAFPSVAVRLPISRG